MVKTGLGILFLFLPFYVLAQGFTPDPDWRFENFNSQNHFISRQISDLAIDKNNYVWTSSSGIQRFDGYKTTEFNSVDESKTTLRSNYTDVAADNDGRIWVSSEGLCYYDDASGKFVYIQTDRNHVITYTQGFCFQKNFLWFVCNYGLARLNLRTLKISFTTLSTITDPLGTFLINENTLLIASREKVYTYAISTDSYSTNTLIYNNSLVKIDAVAKSGANIFISSNKGLFTFNNLKDISVVCVQTTDVLLNDILFLPEDKEKKYLFIATDGNGIMVYNTLSKKVEYTYVHDENNPYSLADNTVNKLFADKKGRLWVSTRLGISMVDVFNQQLKMRFIDGRNTHATGISKISRDKYDSTKVWMSSYSQGMICINWQTKKTLKIYNAFPETNRIYDCEQVSKNKWLLATQKKLIEWNPRRGILSEIKLPVPDSVDLLYFIHRIMLTDNNTCYIFSNIGLFKYDLKNHKISGIFTLGKVDKRADPLKYNLQHGFYDNGTIWAASRNGLFSYNLASQETQIYRGKGKSADYFLFDVAKASNNRIVCAAGDGISIFDERTKHFTIINSLAHLYKPDCENVIGLKNIVWITSGSGILNYDLDSHSSAMAEHETSMIEIFPASPFAVIGKDIVFGFSNGYAWFTPSLKNALLPSDPVLEGISINNQPVFKNKSNAAGRQQLVLTHTDNSITIKFTAFLYTDPDHIKFRYRLKGADSKWLYAEDQRSANYAQLRPGTYTFYLQSGNKNGIWNQHQASFDFVIKPPFWETWWFRTLVTLLIAFGLYSLYRYKVKHLLAIERIREKIASDFHDDIGAALSSISIFSEVADTQLEEQLPREQTREIISHISFQSHAMLDALDDIIWAVNPQNDHFYDLAVRMREFAIPLLEAKNILFDINIREEILNTRIKMEIRKNIFLVFKECINNIVKHSGCTEMKVSVTKVNNQLEMIISDNGIGFDIEATSSRNGLKNMQKRALEIRGKIVINTQQGKGTITLLQVNTV